MSISGKHYKGKQINIFVSSILRKGIYFRTILSSIFTAFYCAIYIKEEKNIKRKNNLYKNLCSIKNIEEVYNEVCKNTRNKRKVELFKEYKCLYITRIYNILEKREYKPGKYNIFTIYEPKERTIISQNMQDKVINHLVTRQILYPALLPCLIDENVASRKSKGTKKGLEYYYKYIRNCKIQYPKYYILKCDISKYFASIDHEILKNKLVKKIKDKEALKIVFDIIDSYDTGLGIGNMTSQCLAIFYLNDLDHYIKEDLKIKYYVRYQDDFVLFHKSKQYLEECLKNIKEFLLKEKLTLNRKTRIYSGNQNFIFLGRKKNRNYANYRRIKGKLKKRHYLYNNNKIDLNSLTSSINSFYELDHKYTEECINKLKINY